MILRKLLVATSIVAISAGAANALNVTVNGTAVTPALERELPGTPAFDGVIGATLNTDSGFYPSGNNIVFTVTLPEGVKFDEAVTGATFTAEGPGTPEASAVVQSGGAEGGDTVEFLVSIDSGEQVNGLTLDFAYRLDACVAEDAGITMTAETETGTAIQGGTATGQGIIAPCESAIDGVVTSDEGASDSFITLNSDYTQFTGDSDTTVVGTVEYAIDTNVSIDVVLDGGTPNVDQQPVPLTVGDIDEITFDIVFSDGENIDNVTVGGLSPETFENGVASFVVDSTSTVTLTQLTSGPQDITVVVSGSVPGMEADILQTQTVSLQNAVVNFNDSTADLVATEDGATGDLDTLQREGQQFGVYDWNSGQSSGTVSVYRVTGLPSDGAAYSVIMTNAGTANGTYDGFATPNANGEFIMNSTSFGDVGLMSYVRGDVEFIFETDVDVDVDRLMARNGIVSAFGDGSNVDDVLGNNPAEDSDNR